MPLVSPRSHTPSEDAVGIQNGVISQQNCCLVRPLAFFQGRKQPEGLLQFPKMVNGSPLCSCDWRNGPEASRTGTAKTFTMMERTANKFPLTRVSTLVTDNKYMCVGMVNVLASKLQTLI